MKRALALAEAASEAGEVPVGAVITDADGRIVAEAGNAMRVGNDPTAHAEMLAIRRAGEALFSSRLDGHTLWVTLEPCAMCAGAIALARIEKLVFAAEDSKGGGVLHGARIFSQTTCHHRPEILSGIGEKEASLQLRKFFKERR
ncbi:nucleoside deaminase [Sphingomicrobium clamense]|nr:nucleoside deaminase [Sphingomicrobium sp. B8]